MTRGARKALWEFAASPSSRSRWPRGRSGAEAAAAAAEEEGGRAGSGSGAAAGRRETSCRRRPRCKSLVRFCTAVAGAKGFARLTYGRPPCGEGGGRRRRRGGTRTDDDDAEGAFPWRGGSRAAVPGSPSRAGVVCEEGGVLAPPFPALP